MLISHGAVPVQLRDPAALIVACSFVFVHIMAARGYAPIPVPTIDCGERARSMSFERDVGARPVGSREPLPIYKLSSALSMSLQRTDKSKVENNSH